MKKRLVLILCALACVGLLSGCWQVEPLEEESPELLQPGEIREEDGKRSLLPEQLVRAWIDAGFVATCALENAPLDRRHSIVWHKNKNLTPSALELIRLCRAAVHENNEGEK